MMMDSLFIVFFGFIAIVMLIMVVVVVVSLVMIAKTLTTRHAPDAVSTAVEIPIPQQPEPKSDIPPADTGLTLDDFIPDLTKPVEIRIKEDEHGQAQVN